VGPAINGNAAIAVKLIEMATAHPLRNTRVSLRNAQRQLLAGLMTGSDGSTVFEQLPLGRYFVQVRRHQQNWEIPLVIARSTSLQPPIPMRPD
jgi:hypothetical protein